MFAPQHSNLFLSHLDYRTHSIEIAYIYLMQTTRVGKRGYNIAKPDKTNVLCYLSSNQVSLIEHHLTAKSQQVKN
jgi:hypothetical protein